MNNKSSKRPVEAGQADPKLITCALHVSETLNIPIRQETPVKHPVHFAGRDFADTNENLLEIMSTADKLRCKSTKFVFNAPTFAEMMLDAQKLEATLQAIEMGEDIQAPVSHVRVSQDEFAAESRQFFFAGLKQKEFLK